MRTNTARFLVPSLMLAILAVPTLARAGGGPHAEVRAAEAGLPAVAMVQTYDCGTPAALKVTAVAERLERGQRRTTPVHLTSAGSIGLYSVTKPWADEKPWVLRVRSTKNGWTSVTVAKFDAHSRFVSYDRARDARDADKMVATALASVSDAR